MPAIQTSYGEMQPAVEGQPATQCSDDHYTTRKCETSSAGIAFGRAVSEGSNAYGCVLGGNDFVGISTLDKTLVNSYLDSYLFGNNVSIILQGDIWVRVMAAVTHGAIASYSAITGQFNPVADGIEVYGSRYLTSAGAGQVALLRLVGFGAGEEEEGGGAPDWVPANAKIHIDLLGDRAWTRGDGEVAIDTLLGSDPNTESGWTVTSYDPTHLTANGYVSTTTRLEVAAIGALRTKILAGATVAWHTKQVGLSSGYNACALLTDDAASAITFTMDFGDLVSKAEAWSGTLALSTAASLVKASGAFNIMALTITPLRVELATNASTAMAAVISETEFPVTGAHPMAAALFSMNADHALQAITVYDPLPNTTGLSELSIAVPEPNEAPTIIIVNTALTFIEAEVTSGSSIMNDTSATDPEGGHITFSLPDNGGGKFTVDPNFGQVVCTVNLLAASSPFAFTIRATDPGGLYDEQEVTVTVTA